MGEEKGSILVHLLVVVLNLVAFGFAVAAELRRSTSKICVLIYTPLVENSVGHGGDCSHMDFSRVCCLCYISELFCGDMFLKTVKNSSYYVYNSDVATGYGVGSFLFLLSSQSLLMGVTRCMCFGRPLAPGSDRAWSIIYFALSWLAFPVAQTCLVAGAKTNAYHTQYGEAIYAQNVSCATLRKGVFIARAVFVIATMVLNIYYYVYFSRATSGQAAQKANRSNSTFGMTGYA